LEKVCVDGGYRGELVEWTTAHYPWELEIVNRPPDQKGFAVLPRRWVVERTFGWLNRYRLLSKEYEATTESSTADSGSSMCSGQFSSSNTERIDRHRRRFPSTIGQLCVCRVHQVALQ
jgi:transposase